MCRSLQFLNYFINTFWLALLWRMSCTFLIYERITELLAPIVTFFLWKTFNNNRKNNSEWNNNYEQNSLINLPKNNDTLNEFFI